MQQSDVASAAQSGQIALTPLPPKPTCKHIFNSGPCNDLWAAYNQALKQRAGEEIQNYANHQKQLASAPLEAQIADQQSEIGKLQTQIQAQTIVAQQSEIAARKDGQKQGAEIGVAASLVLFAVIFGVRKLASGFSISKKPQSNAAVSGK